MFSMLFCALRSDLCYEYEASERANETASQSRKSVVLLLWRWKIRSLESCSAAGAGSPRQTIAKILKCNENSSSNCFWSSREEFKL